MNNISSQNIKKIAIVKLSALGDIIHAMLGLQILKKHFPKLQIDWIVEESFAEVLRNNQDIDNVLCLNLKRLKKSPSKIFTELKKIRKYKKNSYDLVIDAQGLIKSGLCTFLLGKNSVGFDKNSIREKLASIFYKQKISLAYDENTIIRNLTIFLEPFGIKFNKNMILDKKPFLGFKNEDKIIYDYLSKKQKNIIFIIGATWKSRCYPKEQLLKLAFLLKENILIAWGNEEEKQRALCLEEHCEFIKALPKLDLNSLKAIISKSDLLIGNDTGPTHLAWALNIPSITLFGPTPMSRVYETISNKMLKSPSKVNHFNLDKNDFSIKEIKEKDIFDLAKNLLI